MKSPEISRSCILGSVTKASALTMTVTTILLITTITPKQACAEVEAQTLIRQYDDGETQITSPSMDVTGSFNHDTMKIGVGTAQDMVTSASADVRAFGSRGVDSKISERRKEYSTSFETNIPDGTLGMSYIQSDENDYHSKVFSASGTREFFQKNTVVNFGLVNGQDAIESSSNKTFHEAMTHQNYSLSLSQVLSRNSLAQLIYDLRIENGFLASPYRRAKVISASGTVSGVPENHPRTRNRNAVAIKYNHYVEKIKSTLATTYRFYFDNWGVYSQTLEERMTREFGPKFGISLVLRYYYQLPAKFYADYYQNDPGVFYTGNTTLANYDSVLLSLRPSFKFNDKIELYLKGEVYRVNYRNASDPGNLSDLSDDKPLVINAHVVGLGLVSKF